jgi:hypothetical protein
VNTALDYTFAGALQRSDAKGGWTTRSSST